MAPRLSPPERQFPSPHPGIINFFSEITSKTCTNSGVSVPSSGDYQFLLTCPSFFRQTLSVSVPSSGDYQFLLDVGGKGRSVISSFRPLIRGLSISSTRPSSSTTCGHVSVPSSGDYQFLRPHLQGQRLHQFGFRPLIRGLSISSVSQAPIRVVIMFPSPHPGIINFFGNWISFYKSDFRFRPLIRGLSISSE